jgi:hypothetical protein
MMTMASLTLICGLVFLVACGLGLIGLLVYHFTQKDRADN